MACHDLGLQRLNLCTWCVQVEVLVHVVSALFDINPSMSTHMAPPLWRRCIGVLFEVRRLQSHLNSVDSSQPDLFLLRPAAELLISFPESVLHGNFLKLPSHIIFADSWVEGSIRGLLFPPYHYHWTLESRWTLETITRHEK